MMEWIVSILLISGSLFMLVAAIGVVKLSDVYMRMHAITKAASLGAILMLAAVLLWYPQWIVAIEALMVVLFVILTAPIGAHMLARVAHRMKVPIGEGYIMDELQDAIDRKEMDPDMPEEEKSIDAEKL
ncbi:MAG: monovalent cation/H(+) antiporter subunit G [Bacteroidia bacterium]|nr:MAG: monovalent cation/H(+) antiporter subunit G [Bacteroidia bacterium]